MGNILDGLNPVNKIGTVPINFNSTLNTLPTQGFRLNTGNLLSNITNTKGFTPPGGTKFASVVPNVETLSQAKAGPGPGKVLVESSGYDVTTLGGKTAWVPNGSSYNEVAELLGAPSNNEVIGAVVDGVFTTIDLIALRGAGRAISVAGKVIGTAGQVRTAAFLLKTAGTAFNYSYGQGYDLPSSLIAAFGTQANFANLKLFKDTKFVQNSPLLSVAANTSEKYYDLLHHSELIPSIGKYKNKFAGVKFTLTDNLAVKFGFLPFNPGGYILNKTWATPTAFFKGKVGKSQQEYESKYEAKHEQEEIILTGLQELENQTSTKETHGSVENIYETKFLEVLGKFENQRKAADLGGASKRLANNSDNIQKEGLNILGNTAAYSRAIATFAYEQIDEFQSYKAERNAYQKKLMDATTDYYGNINYPALVFATAEGAKTAVINIGLSTANVALGATRLAINTAEVLTSIPVTISNYGVIQAQILANNLKIGLEKLSNWWNDVPDKVEMVTSPASSKITTKKKSPTANVTNTMINMPAFIPPTKMTDNLRVAGPVSNNPAILDRYKTPEQIAIRESSKFVQNVRAEQQKKLDKLVEAHEVGFFTFSKPKWTPEELKEQQKLTLEIHQLSLLLKGVADAVKKGRLKYDPFTRKVSKLW
jgi:hypothetical protein